MKKETKHIIRTLGAVLFILYVLALIYFLFFSEEYGRVAMEEREYRYNLIPFVEIRRFWVYRKQLGFLAVFTNLFGNVIGFLPFGFILPVILERMRSGYILDEDIIIHLHQLLQFFALLNEVDRHNHNA